MGHVIGFMPASGGVGATTLAAALAVRAVQADRRAVAVDLDSLRGLGGRLDVTCGVEQEPGWRWDRLVDVDGVVDGQGLARELPEGYGVSVLSGVGLPVERWATVLPDVVAGLARVHDVTVLDLPRDDRVLSAVAGLLDALVVVVGTQVPQLAAAATSLPGVRDVLRAALEMGKAAGVGTPPEAGTAAEVNTASEASLAPAVSAARGAGMAPGEGTMARLGSATGPAGVPLIGREPVAGPRSGGRFRPGEIVQLVELVEMGGSVEPVEPWVVLRGARADADLEDLVSDQLDVPVLGFVRDDPRVSSEVADGIAPGVRGRGPVVDVADRLLLRLVGQRVAA